MGERQAETKCGIFRHVGESVIARHKQKHPAYNAILITYFEIFSYLIDLREYCLLNLHMNLKTDNSAHFQLKNETNLSGGLISL